MRQKTIKVGDADPANLYVYTRFLQEGLPLFDNIRKRMGKTCIISLQEARRGRGQ